jgi:hypothetical protein
MREEAAAGSGGWVGMIDCFVSALCKALAYWLLRLAKQQLCWEGTRSTFAHIMRILNY